MNGGERIARVLSNQGVEQLFTLCGGHISPILVSAKRAGIRVIDVRHEANAVFAADAVARLTGVPGVAAVTAGPGVTNTITAVKNAQLAQSPVIVLGGATATVLRDRGALQDIDQLALFEPHVKWAVRVDRLRNLVPALERAFDIAQRDVPGPVFVECPVDLLYDEPTVREFYGAKAAGEIKSAFEIALQAYLRVHLLRVFRGSGKPKFAQRVHPRILPASPAQLYRAADMLAEAERPVLVIGSQATLGAAEIDRVVEAVERLNIPVYLSGMARGLLGQRHPTWFRHKRGAAIKEADLVLLAGVPCDFRLDYGRQIRSRTKLISVNRAERDLLLNKRPTLAVQADPGRFLRELAEVVVGRPDQRWHGWKATLRARDDARNREIAAMSEQSLAPVHPLKVVRAIEALADQDSVFVADGGDFVATASYVVSPRGPLSWLDPGAFGTLGVGGGFATGAKLVRPNAEVWILYGDGSVGYTLPEFDTFVRLGLPVIAVVGNDACWSQIARDQEVILGDPIGTELARTDYHVAAEGFGGRGLVIRNPTEVEPILREAKRLAREGHPVLVNVHLGRSEFRKGSISM